MALASNPALEALVREHDDEASWQVLEDWLLETNDPRATLVRLEKAGEDTTSALRELAPLLLGADEARIDAHEWRAGFARRATIFGAPASVPGLALVRDLTLRVDVPALRHLAPLASQLEALAFECRSREAIFEGAELATLARLERLRLAGPTIDVRDLAEVPALRHLELGLGARSVGALIETNPLAELRSLSIRTGTFLYPWHGVFDPLFEGACAPKLEELHLDASATSGNLDFFRDLAQSPLGGRLRRLTLAGTECWPPMLRRFGVSLSRQRAG